MKKLLITVLALFVAFVGFSQEKNTSLQKYGLAAFHYSPPNSSIIYSRDNIKNIGASMKFGIEYLFPGTNLAFETGVGLGYMSYTSDGYRGPETEQFPYMFVPMGIGYKIHTSSTLSLYPHLGIAGMLSVPYFQEFMIGGIAPIAGLTLQINRFLIDVTYNINWPIDAYQSGMANIGFGVGWVF